MVRLYYPPSALLPKGNREYVELAGAKCILAMDEEKQFIVISNVFSELSWGEFWKEAAISDQIEKIQVKHDDSEALYDSHALAKKIISAFDKIIKRRLILFGVATFEGNMFETTAGVLDLSQEDTDRLMNLYRAQRMQNAFPNLKKGAYVDTNFFSTSQRVVSFFTLPKKKDLRGIASQVYPYSGQTSGVVAVAQGAANFIILTDNIFKGEDQETRIDKQNLDQMFSLLKKEVLSSPISWFKIDLGLKGLEALDGWEEIENDPEVQKARANYMDYLRSLIIQKNTRTIEHILADDLGKPIVISNLTEEEIEADTEEILDALNELNELSIFSEEISLLYFPPKILLAAGEKKQLAIGGSYSILSIDVGKNLICIEDLREDISWGQFDSDIGADDDEIFDNFKDEQYFDVENPGELRDIYTKAFQKIMKNSQVYFGTLELESNGFSFSLFQELEIPDDKIEKLQDLFRKKSKSGNFPKLNEDHITIRWFGEGKDYFTNNDCQGILDLAEKFRFENVYKDGYVSGIVCVDDASSSFHILTSSFTNDSKNLDNENFDEMIVQLENSNTAPLCWFKISLGLENLKRHPFWKIASQYAQLLHVLDNYTKYVEELLQIKENEERNRIY